MGDRDVVIPISAPGADRAAADIGKVAQSGSLLASAFGKVFGAESGTSLLQFGKLFAGANVVAGGMRAAAGIISAISGDSSKLLENFEKLPFGLGHAVAAGHELFDVINDTAGKAERLAQLSAGIAGNRAAASFGLTGIAGLQDQATAQARNLSLARLTGVDRERASLSGGFDDQRKAVIDQLASIVAEASKKQNEVILKDAAGLDPSGKIQDKDSLLKRVNELSGEVERRRIQLETARLDIANFDVSTGGRERERDLAAFEQRSIKDLAEAKAKLKPFTDVLNSSSTVFSSTVGNAGGLAQQLIQNLTERQAIELQRVGGDLRGAGPAIEGRLLTGAGQQFDPQMQATKSIESNSATIAELMRQSVSLLQQLLSAGGIQVAGP